jgi:hypothetical protein
MEMPVCNFTWTEILDMSLCGKISDWVALKQGAEEDILAQ